MRIFLLCLFALSIFAVEPPMDDLGVRGLRKLQMTVPEKTVDPQLLVYMKALKLAPVEVPPAAVQDLKAKDFKKEEQRFQKAFDHREACKRVNVFLSGDEDRYNPVHGYSTEFIKKDKDAMLLTLARNTDFMRSLEDARGGHLPPFVYKP